MNREKVIKILADYHEIVGPNDMQRLFYIALCNVQLGEYVQAQREFEASFLGMFTPPKLWYGTNQPNWLVDICFLSNRTDKLLDVQRELEIFKRQFDKQYGLVAHYAFGLLELYLPSGWNISGSIEELLKRPKIKDMHAIGLALRAIMDDDALALQEALLVLLKAHEGMAKYGGFRETAEGLLCMPAMTLGRTALKRNLTIEIVNDYYSSDYLQFLMEHTSN